MKKIKISASILNANFLSLKSQLDQINDAGINTIHFDVMDGNFVNNLSFGTKVLQDITTKYKNFFIECHMMVKIINRTIEQYLQPFVDAGANSFILHYEALSKNQWVEFIKFAKKNNIIIGLAINPETSIKLIEDYLKDLNVILVMSVNPGFGAQKFLESTIQKIKQLQLLKSKYNFEITVDGGINNATAKKSISAGVDNLVIGSHLINSSNMKKCVEDILDYE